MLSLSSATVSWKNWAQLTPAQKVKLLNEFSPPPKSKPIAANIQNTDQEKLALAELLKKYKADYALAEQQVSVYKKLELNAKTLTQENNAYKNKIKEVEDKLKVAVSNKTQLTEELEKLKNKYDKFKQNEGVKFLNLHAENKQLLKDLNAKTNAIAILEQSKKTLEDKIQQIELQLGTAQSQLAAEQAKVLAANTDVALLKQQHQGDMQEQLRQYNQLKQDAMQTAEALQKNLIAEQSKLSKLEEQKSQELGVEKERYEKLKNDSIQLVAEMNKNLAELKTKLGESNAKIEILRNLANEKEKHNQALLKLQLEKQAELEGAKENWQQIEAAYKQKLQQANDEYEKVVAAAEQKIEQVVAKSEQQLAQLKEVYETRLKNKENELNLLQNMIKTQQTLINNRTKDLDATLLENSKLNIEIEAMIDEKVQLEKQWSLEKSEYEKSIQQLSKTLLGNEIVQQNMDKELEQLGRSNQELLKEANKHLKAKTEAQGKVVNLQKQLDNLTGKFAKQKQEDSDKLKKQTDKYKQLADCVTTAKNMVKVEATSDPVLAQLVKNLNTCLGYKNI